MAHRFLISHDTPALYITIVTKDRLPVFRTDLMKEILCRAIDGARKSAGFLLFATEKNVLPIFSEGMFMEKVNYICENEQLMMDNDLILEEEPVVMGEARTGGIAP